MRLWRIAAETRDYAADDLSGAGAARHPGRWNAAQEPVIYTATSPALATLETLAHLPDSGLPLNRYLVQIEVPAASWAARERRTPAQLPTTWDAIPAGLASVRVGSAWLSKGNTLLMELPSAIVPEESVVLINPRHPDAHGLRARAIRRVEFQRSLRSGP